jgi:hypothetical protein
VSNCEQQQQQQEQPHQREEEEEQLQLQLQLQQQHQQQHQQQPEVEREEEEQLQQQQQQLQQQKRLFAAPGAASPQQPGLAYCFTPPPAESLAKRFHRWFVPAVSSFITRPWDILHRDLNATTVADWKLNSLHQLVSDEVHTHHGAAMAEVANVHANLQSHVFPNLVSPFPDLSSTTQIMYDQLALHEWRAKMHSLQGTGCLQADLWRDTMQMRRGDRWQESLAEQMAKGKEEYKRLQPKQSRSASMPRQTATDVSSGAPRQEAQDASSNVARDRGAGNADDGFEAELADGRTLAEGILAGDVPKLDLLNPPKRSRSASMPRQTAKRVSSSTPQQEAQDASSNVARVSGAGNANDGLETELANGHTLAEGILAGEVPKPDLLSWPVWQKWRRSNSRPLRPGSSHPSYNPFQRREAELWRVTMQKLHGDRWQEALAEQIAKGTEESKQLQSKQSRSASVPRQTAKRVSSSAPQQEAQDANSKYARVSGAANADDSLEAELTNGHTLAEGILAGNIPEPDLLSWPDWQKWRRSHSRPLRPGSSHPSYSPFQRREAELWRVTMQKLHGDRWQEALAEQIAKGTEESKQLQSKRSRSASVPRQTAKRVSSSAPQQEAQDASSKYARVSGAANATNSLEPELTNGHTLAEGILAGNIPEPDLLSWPDWQKWRRSNSRPLRPGSSHPSYSPFQRREAELWRVAMQKLHGDRWQEALAEQIAKGTEESKQLQSKRSRSASVPRQTAKRVSSSAPQQEAQDASSNYARVSGAANADDGLEAELTNCHTLAEGILAGNIPEPDLLAVLA